MRRIEGAIPALALLAVSGLVAGARAQSPTPPPPPPPPDAVPAPAEPTIADLQAQVAELQELVRASLSRQEELERRLGEIRPVAPGGGPTSASAMPASPAPNPNPNPNATASLSSLAPAPPRPPLATAGAGGGAGRTLAGPGSDSDAQGRGLMPPGYPGASMADMPAPARSLDGRVKFGPGFQISTEDDEFVFQFHNLTQVDGRFYEQGGQGTTRDTFGIPRQWFIFNGQLTRPFEYYVALNEGFDNLNLLDAFLNIRYDDRLQIRFGRYKTPFTYEFYGLPINGLITPERSQFFNNFGLNRDVGLMAWGNLFEKRFEYAVGIFNGSRNAFLDFDDNKDVAAFLNARPFAFYDLPALRNFSVGGSLVAGQQLEPRIPPILRLNVPTTANASIGVPFLAFRDGVLESGGRALWSLHMAWYYRQLSLIGEWQSGYETYAFRETPQQRTPSVTQSYYVAAGYFLTGEQVTSRGVVAPLRPFDPRRGKRGPGAIELAFRYNYLDVGDAVFTGGFSDPDLWSDRVQSIDLGVNWYLTQYVKIFGGWQHNEFGSPVLYRTQPTDQFQLTDDLFWFRFQVYF